MRRSLLEDTLDSVRHVLGIRAATYMTWGAEALGCNSPVTSWAELTNSAKLL